MAWRDNLRSASFRGVSFEVDSSTLTAGRRLARHEYPQRDEPFLEDMGKKAREYRIEAFIIGPEYMSGRDQLLEALEKPGPGQLVHPYLGTLKVIVSGQCQMTESTSFGGMAKISIEMVEAGTQQEPRATDDTLAVLDAQIAAAEEIAALEFSESFSVDGAADFVVEDALKSVNGLLSVPGMVLDNLASIRANPLSALQALLPERLLGSLSSPLGLAKGIVQLVRNMPDVLQLFGYGLPSPIQTVQTPARQQLNSNRDALMGLVSFLAVVKRTRDLVSAEPDTLDLVRAHRTEIVDRVDDLIFSELIGQDAIDAIVQIRTDAVKHFTAITPDLPRIVAREFAVALPALVVAHDFYGDQWLDQEREAELIKRNLVKHPGFVPAGKPVSLVS